MEKNLSMDDSSDISRENDTTGICLLIKLFSRFCLNIDLPVDLKAAIIVISYGDAALVNFSSRTLNPKLL